MRNVSAAQAEYNLDQHGDEAHVERWLEENGEAQRRFIAETGADALDDVLTEIHKLLSIPKENTEERIHAAAAIGISVATSYLIATRRVVAEAVDWAMDEEMANACETDRYDDDDR